MRPAITFFNIQLSNSRNQYEANTGQTHIGRYSNTTWTFFWIKYKIKHRQLHVEGNMIEYADGQR